MSVGPAEASRLDSIAASFQARRGVPGLSIEIVRDGESVFSGSYGFAIVDERPVTRETVYELGSIKKPVTAAAVLHADEAGLLSIDDPVGQYASSIRIPGDVVLIRHMLHQVSGLPEVYDGSLIETLDFVPGSRWAYRNTNFDRMDEVLISATGLSFDDYLGRHFRTTLAMCDEAAPDPPHLAQGYTPSEEGPIPTDKECWFRGTIPDLAHWFDTLFSGGVINADAVEAMVTPFELANGPTEYGLGVALRPYRGLTRYSHTGHMSGFTSSVGHYPDYRMTIAVAGNSDGLFDPDAIEMAIATALFDLSGASDSAGPDIRDNSLGQIDHGGVDIDTFEGSYVTDGLAFRFEAQGDVLSLRMTPEESHEPQYVSTTIRRTSAFDFVGVDSPDAVRVRFDGDTAYVYVVGIPWVGTSTARSNQPATG